MTIETPPDPEQLDLLNLPPVDWSPYVADAENPIGRSRRLAMYYKSPECLRVRSRIFREAGYHCQNCNATQHLQMHHTKEGYRHLGSEILGRDVLVLCRRCHMVEPGHGDEYRWTAG